MYIHINLKSLTIAKGLKYQQMNSKIFESAKLRGFRGSVGVRVKIKFAWVQIKIAWVKKDLKFKNIYIFLQEHILKND